jgi:hypothetical protein
MVTGLSLHLQTWDQLELLVQLDQAADLQVPLVQQVQQVPLALWAPLDHRELQVQQVTQVRLVQQDQLAQQAHRAFKEFKE